MNFFRGQIYNSVPDRLVRPRNRFVKSIRDSIWITKISQRRLLDKSVPQRVNENNFDQLVLKKRQRRAQTCILKTSSWDWRVPFNFEFEICKCIFPESTFQNVISQVDITSFWYRSYMYDASIDLKDAYLPKACTLNNV